MTFHYRHLALAVLPFASVNPTSVQLPVDENARLTAGVVITHHHNSYTAKDGLSILPQAFYDNNKWYIEGAESGYYPYKDAKNHLRVGLSYDGRSFDASDAKHDDLKQLDDRKSSINAHASYMHITPYGGLKAKISTDVLGRHQGQVLTLSHLSKFNKDNWTIHPEFGAAWHSKKYNQYYYGVSDAQSEQSGVPSYQAKSGFSPFANVTASYKLTDQISVFGNQRVEWLSSGQKNSPMTDGALDSKTRFGVNYKF